MCRSSLVHATGEKNETLTYRVVTLVEAVVVLAWRPQSARRQQRGPWVQGHWGKKTGNKTSQHVFEPSSSQRTNRGWGRRGRRKKRLGTSRKWGHGHSTRISATRSIMLVTIFATVLLTMLTQVSWAAHSWTTEVIDQTPSGFTNLGTSIATDSLGNPHVAYTLSDSYDLKYGVRRSSIWNIDVVSPHGGSLYLSLKLDSLERPHIAYYGDNSHLIYASKEGSTWTTEIADPGTDCGRYASLAIDSSDRPHIAYICGSANLEVRYASWDGTQWVIESIAFGVDSVSLALDSKNRPHIIYYVSNMHQLTHTYSVGFGWSTDIVDVNVNITSRGTSIAFDALDQAHVSYVDDDTGLLKYAKSGLLGWSIEVVDDPVRKFCQGRYGSSIALNGSGNPRIAYFICRNGERSLGYAWKDATWSKEVADSQGLTGANPSLAIDLSDSPHIAYLHHMAGEIMYAFYREPDTRPPVSRVLPISPYWNGESVRAEAKDFSGVATVTLWYRHSSDNTTWSGWMRHSMLNSPPWYWSFAYPSGEGYYEFYSTAVDNLGFTEPPPPTADAIAGYDATAPVSSALQPPAYWHSAPPVVVDATATDNLSGLENVTLLYSYAVDNATWGGWTVVGTKNSKPWFWSFQFPDGRGHYRFYSIAKDVAGNIEGGKTTAEAIAGYRGPGPTTSLLILGSNYTNRLTYVKSSTPLDFLVMDHSGVGIRGTKYRMDNATWLDHSGQFRLTSDGAHYVEWYSEDNADNVENASHKVLIVDDSPPSVSLLPEDSRVYVGTSFSLTANDGQGCGVAVLEYRIDEGSWIPYSSPFNLSEGRHNITYRSWDHLNNSAARTHSVEVVGPENPPDVKTEVNYKPFVAAVFAINLAVVGLWSSRRRPWKDGKGRMAVTKAFMFTSMPFVLAEAATGVASFLTGQLSMPPLVGAGTAVDLAILLAGIVVAILRIVRTKPLGAGETNTPQKR